MNPAREKNGGWLTSTEAAPLYGDACRDVVYAVITANALIPGSIPRKVLKIARLAEARGAQLATALQREELCFTEQIGVLERFLSADPKLGGVNVLDLARRLHSRGMRAPAGRGPGR